MVTARMFSRENKVANFPSMWTWWLRKYHSVYDVLSESGIAGPWYTTFQKRGLISGLCTHHQLLMNVLPSLQEYKDDRGWKRRRGRGRRRRCSSSRKRRGMRRKGGEEEWIKQKKNKEEEEEERTPKKNCRRNIDWISGGFCCCFFFAIHAILLLLIWSHFMHFMENAALASRAISLCLRCWTNSNASFPLKMLTWSRDVQRRYDYGK